MHKKIFTAGICLLFVSLAAADKVNLLKNGDFSRYKVNWVTDGEVKEEGKTGVLILSGKATRAFSRQVMELDARNDELLLSADVTADKPVQVLIGFVPVDRNWKEIFFRNTGAVSGTFTVLDQPAQKNTKKLILKDKVRARKGNYAALYARQDSGDLPNFNLERIQSVSEDGKTILTLTRNLRKTLPAGTGIRIHTDGATYLYAANLQKGFPGQIRAQGRIGGSSTVPFRKGTAGCRLCILILPRKSAPDSAISKYSKSTKSKNPK